MARIKCSICRKLFDPAESKTLPFCSDRCRQIDLGRWLDEGYSVPHVRTDEDEDEPAVQDRDDDE